MQVFRFWAQGQSEAEYHGAPIHAYGCSNESIEAALADARRRADRVVETLKSPDPSAYSYDRPMREEIVRELTLGGRITAVLTRNAQGAVVLNTANVFFADIDYEPQPVSLGVLLGKLLGRKSPNPDDVIMERISAVVSAHPGLGVRVYRTSNGFRCLVKSRPYDPLADKTIDLLRQFGSDDLYVKLCRAQECFRARVSPKPWRCGSRKPPLRFPFADSAQEEQFRSWQRDYESIAEQFSVCALIGDLGSEQVHPEIAPVMELHDHFACAGAGPAGVTGCCEHPRSLSEIAAIGVRLFCYRLRVVCGCGSWSGFKPVLLGMLSGGCG